MNPFTHSWGPDRIRLGLRVVDVRDPRHVAVVRAVEAPLVLVVFEESGFSGAIPVERLRREPLDDSET